MASETWHTLSELEILKILGARKEGLTKEEAEARLQQYGLNEIAKRKKRTALIIFLSQFKSFLTLVLLAAIIISFALGEVIDASVILLVVIVNTSLGFFQEYSAEKAVEALKKLTAPFATVIRSGKKLDIPAKEVVPGDIVYLEEGKRVPADMRITNQANLNIDESSLTGESVPVSKRESVLEKEVEVADMANMAFMSTYVTNGVGTGITVEIGMNTEIGKIAKSVEESESPATPLQVRLEQLGKYLGISILIVSAIIFLLGVYIKEASLLDMFLVSVALAISAIPEGLPAVVTLALSLGVKRMASKNAIIKRLLAVETLGTTSVICADKTGTLTKNEMTVEQVYVNNEFISVSGKGYEPIGEFFINDEYIDIHKIKALMLLLKTVTLCNNSSLDKTDNGWEMVGDPTEGALTVLGKKAGFEKHELKKQYQFITEIPFSSKRKMMSVIYEEDKNKFAYVKGAPEQIVKKCKFIFTKKGIKKLTKAESKRLTDIYRKMAAQPLRVLGVAYKKLPNKIKNYTEENIESELTFLGIVGMEDPIRDGVKSALIKAQEAGIKTVMITGDHELTAASIARQLGILGKNEIVLTGLELESMSQAELEDVIEKTSVYARVSPEHKVRILEAFQKKGHVVAMTGDGVNDAPAIKKADIGISMGIKGTDVAKEASDMILTDDHYATIVSAVEEGRGLYANIRKFVRQMLAVNLIEIFLIAMAFIVDMPLPLLPLQLLWINLVTDSFLSVSLAMDPAEKDIMKIPPRKKNESIFSGGMAPFLIITAIIGSLASIMIFIWGLQFGIDKARTIVLTFCVMYETLILFNCRSETKPFFKVNPFSNIYLFLSALVVIGLQFMVLYLPFMQSIFVTAPLSGTEWLVVLLFCALGLIVSPSFFNKKKSPT